MPHKSYWLAALCTKSLLLLTMEQDQAKTNKLMELFLSQLFLKTINQRELVEFDDRSEIHLKNPLDVINYSGNLVEDFQQILGTNISELSASNAMIPKIVASPTIIPKTVSSPSLATTSGESNVNPGAELPSAQDSDKKLKQKKKSRSAKLAELEMQIQDLAAAKKAALIEELNVSPQHNEKLVTQPPPMIPFSAEPLASPPVLETVSGESNINPLEELISASEQAVLSSLPLKHVLDERTGQINSNASTIAYDPRRMIKIGDSILTIGSIPRSSDLDNKLAKFSNDELKEIHKSIVDNFVSTSSIEVFNFFSYELADLKKEELQEIMRRVDCHVYFRQQAELKSKKKKKKL